MLKKNKKEKNKDKKVHFIEEQIIDQKKKRPKSSDKTKIKTNINVQPASNKKTTIEDFTLMQELGSGSYAKVILAKLNSNERKYAIKKINKNMLNNFQKQHEVHIEKICLAELKHPNIIKLHKTFQDKKHLYFVLDYCRNRDMGKLINYVGKFSYDLAKFYAAEILFAICYLHKRGIYHRDLKPENIGLDEEMHIKLFDFATSIKIDKFFDIKAMRFINLDEDEIAYIDKHKKKAEDNIIKINQYTILLLPQLFVGTPEYVAPEVLEHNYSLIGPGVDIWAFGVMLYLFFTGTTPFKAKKESKTLENIKNVKYSFDDKEVKIPDDAKDLISKILVKDPTKRLGFDSKDYSEIKNHPFFKGIVFDNLEFEDPPLSDIREKLEKLGYDIPKPSEDNDNLLNDLYEERKEIEDNDINSDNEINLSLKRASANNFDNLKKKNLKGECVELNIENYKNQGYDKDDIVILEETLKKKSPWLHYNTRVVKFFSKGHIDYFEPKTNELKGSFNIDSNSKVNVIDEYRFEVETTNRTYFFKHQTKKVSNEWKDKLNSFIESCAQKK